MLETNNPYMFGSSTTTTTTTTNQTSQSPSTAPSLSAAVSSASTNNNMQQSRPMHHNNSYYIAKGDKEDFYHNHPHSSRINPNFIRHPEEHNYTSTYKNKNTNNEPERLNNFMRSSVHVYPQNIKREPSPNMLPSSFIKSKKPVQEPDWYERENKSHKPTFSATPTTTPTTTTTTTTTTTPSTTQSTTTTPSTPAEVSMLEAGDNKKIKRRKEMTGTMEELNQEFLKKREQVYIEKANAVNQELKDAHQDKHPAYLDGVKDLEMMRKKTIDDGVLFRKYQNEVTDNQFQLEIYQAEEEYTAEIQDIREKLFASLDEKRRKLKEEKDNCDLAYDVILESQARLHKRNLRKREKEHPENKSSKKKQLTGPALVFKLKDEDILSDIQAMRNGSSSPSSSSAPASAPPKKTSASNKKK